MRPMQRFFTGSTRELRLICERPANQPAGDNFLDEFDKKDTNEAAKKNNILKKFFEEKKESFVTQEMTLSDVIEASIVREAATEEQKVNTIKQAVRRLAGKSSFDQKALEAELRQLTNLEQIKALAMSAGITISSQASKEVQGIRLGREQAEKAGITENRSLLAIYNSIPADNAWYKSDFSESKATEEFRYLRNTTGFYRTDKQARYSEIYRNGRWEFSYEYKPGGRQAWQDKNNYKAIQTENPNAATFVGGDGGLRIQRIYANYMNNPVEREKYLSINNDGRWHPWTEVKGGQETWEYRLYTDNHMYARHAVRNPRNKNQLEWQVMRYVNTTDGWKWYPVSEGERQQQLYSPISLAPTDIGRQYPNQQWTKFRNDGIDYNGDGSRWNNTDRRFGRRF